MVIRKKDKKNILKVGIFISSLTFILMIMVVSIGKETSLFSPKVKIKARVPNVSNLKTGSFVELKGIRIGTVSSIQIVSYDEVEIEMTILEDSLKWIKQDSRVSISTAGLVGDKYIEIISGTRDASDLDPKSNILLSKESTDLKKIMSTGESITYKTSIILEKLDSIISRIDETELIVKTLNSINSAANNIDNISHEIKESKIPLVLKQLHSSSSSLEKILKRVESGPGTMHSLIYDDSVHDHLRSLLGGAQRNKVIKYFIRESIKKADQKNN